ncbi:MAG: phosphatidylserine decarboxylase [Archaeoglobaceae archaeon]|nr:phosphatidylserine decarboxylase [Archaeoglobaceae archaeon]MDW7989179.1 phosphatidylserine decarboxylase [Archaeoglobaceae archaeon]
MLELIEKSASKPLAIILILSVIFLFLYYLLSIILILFLVFTAYFFRDPERKIGDGVISPADGRIDYVGCNQLEIFMSPFDCHINRSPVKGKILSIEFRDGKLIPAYRRGKNVRMNEITIRAGDGIYKVIQIAGIFARRIVCYVREGEDVEKGQRIGLIRFGSRVILELPTGYKFIRRVGEKVKAGETVAVKDEDLQRS